MAERSAYIRKVEGSTPSGPTAHGRGTSEAQYMDDTLQKLLKKKEKALAKLADLKTKLGHPHLDFMSAHDLAESEYRFWEAYLAQVESDIKKLENEQRRK